MTNERYYSDLAIPPGEFLEEVIDDLGMSKEEFAIRMNRPLSKMSQIFNGNKAITSDTALQIEKVTNTPAHFWTNLEANYRLTLSKIAEKQEDEKLKEEAKLVAIYCYSQLVKLGYVIKHSKPVDKVRELHKYFGVTSLNNLTSLKRYAPLYRQQNGDRSKVSKEALAAWLRIGEIKGNAIETNSFSKANVNSLIEDIIKISNTKTDNLKETLESKFASAGIALVIVPHLPKTYAHGAAFWLKDKPVIMVTIRKSWADIFWFSLLHELAHILLHGKGEVFIENDEANYVPSDKEIEADKFASEKLIPKANYDIFKSKELFYLDDIIRFAKSNNINPGIVVGRLQHEKLIHPSWHNSLRTRFVWKEDSE
jgi:HTH-type transcriptional regulator/antitoxin HigA